MEEKIIVNIEETIRNMFKDYFSGKAANVSMVDGELQVQTYDDNYFDDILISDKAIATDYKDIWYLQNCTIDRQEDGTVFTHPTPQGFGYITPSFTGTSALILDYDKEYEIIVDILNYNNPLFSIGLTDIDDDIAYTFNISQWVNYLGTTLKIRITTETIIFLVDDVVKKEVENEYNEYEIGYFFQMRLQGAGGAVKIKDFRIKEIKKYGGL